MPALLGVGTGASFRGGFDSTRRLGKEKVSIKILDKAKNRRTVSGAAVDAGGRGLLLPAAEALAAGGPNKSGALGSPRAARPVAAGIWKFFGCQDYPGLTKQPKKKRGDVL